MHPMNIRCFQCLNEAGIQCKASFGRVIITHPYIASSVLLSAGLHFASSDVLHPRTLLLIIPPHKSFHLLFAPFAFVTKPPPRRRRNNIPSQNILLLLKELPFPITTVSILNVSSPYTKSSILHGGKNPGLNVNKFHFHLKKKIHCPHAQTFFPRVHNFSCIQNLPSIPSPPSDRFSPPPQYSVKQMKPESLSLSQTLSLSVSTSVSKVPNP